MSKTNTLNLSFAGGVVSSEMFGRTDLGQYQTGLKKCENFVIKPSGAATKRPGFEYIHMLPLATSAPRVYPFEKDADNSYALIFFTNGIWFAKNGKLICETAKTVSSISVGSTINLTTAHGWSVGDYIVGKAAAADDASEDAVFKVTAVVDTDSVEVEPLWAALGDTTAPSHAYYARVYSKTTTITEAQLASMRVAQSELTFSIQVEGEYPRELIYVSDADWTYQQVTFAAQIAAPYSPNLATTPYFADCLIRVWLDDNPSTTPAVSTNIVYANRYRITAVSEDGEESVASIDALRADFGAISAATSASPAGLFTTFAVHSLVVGDIIRIETAAGTGAGTAWSTLNGRRFKIRTIPTTSTFTIADVETGAVVDTGAFQSYTANSAGFAAEGIRVNLGTAGYRTRIYFKPTGTPAYRYNIYKQDQRTKVYGFAGTVDPETAQLGGFTTGTTVDDYYHFYDDNITPDATRTPPEEWEPFPTADDCPTAVGYHEQRRVFGGSVNDPQRLFLTQTGFPSSMNQHFPILDNDAFDFRMYATKRQKIQHIMSLGDMLVLTTGGVFQVRGSDGGGITAATVSARPHSFVGATDTNPVECDSTAVFIGKGSEHPYEVAYARDGSGGYVAIDIGVFASDLFDGYTIQSLAFCRGSTPTLWAVRSDGTLLSCTYMPNQDLRGWHVHTTDGTMISACAIPESGIDRLYITVQRNVDGTNYCMLERMRDYRLSGLTAAFFLDSGTTATAAATTTMTGLWHLEGEAVNALADGVVIEDLTVTGGTVTFPAAAAIRTVGRPYTCDLETLPLSFNVAGGGIGRTKNVSEVAMRVEKSDGIWAGNSFDDLYEHKREVSETYSSPAPLLTEVIDIPIDGEWDEDATLCVRSDSPLPATILSMSLSVAIGG